MFGWKTAHRAALLGFMGISLLLICAPFAHAGGTTYTVDHEGDTSGQACSPGTAADCSLRSAIELAQSTTNLDVIDFNYTAFPTYYINLTGPFLDLFNTTFIVAQPGPGPSGAPLVTVDGNQLAPSAFRLTGSASGGSVIEGMSIVNFTGPAIDVSTGLSGAVIRDNFIGLLPDGTALANGIGIRTAEDNTWIGGPGDGGDGNVISGNTGAGIELGCGGGGTFQDNLIGTSPNGLAGMPNGGWGIYDQCTEYGPLQIGGPGAFESNVISNNTAGGIWLQWDEGGDRPFIENNLIGVGSDGTTRLGNEGVGIFLDPGQASFVANNTVAFSNGHAIHLDASDDTVIDGNTLRDSNGHGLLDDLSDDLIIEGNDIQRNWAGIETFGGLRHDLEANTVSNNEWEGIYIGGGNSHWIAYNDILGNGYSGIQMDYTFNIEIEGNTIGENRDGIQFIDSDSNTIWANFIGTDETGTDLGNDCDGIRFAAEKGGTSSNNMIGSPVEGDANVIAYNKGMCGGQGPQTGITVYAAQTTTIRGNSIHSNAGLGIDLVGGTEDSFGVTANDAGDSDSGPNAPNSLTNWPTITAASSSQVSGTLSALPGTEYFIDVYGNTQSDPSDHGEGQSYSGAVVVQTDGNGQAAWTFNGQVTGTFATATATRAQSSSPTGQGPPPPPIPVETSEFSNAFRITTDGDRISSCFDPDPTTECPLSTTTSTTSTSTTTTTTTSSTTTTTTSSTTTTTTTTSPGVNINAVVQVAILQDGERVNSLTGLTGVVEARFQSTDPSVPSANVCIELVNQEGLQVAVTPPGGGTFDLDRLASGYYFARAFVCSGAGFMPLGSSEALAQQTVLVMHPIAETGPTAASVATGVAVIGVVGLIAQTVWARSAFFLGEAGKETVIALGEDRLRGRAAQRALAGAGSGATSHRRYMIRTWAAFIVSVVLLGVFFALEGAERLILSEILDVLPIIGACALFFFAGQFGFEYLASWASGVAARFRFLGSGAISLALSTLIFRVAFGYPGYIDEKDAGVPVRHMMGIRSLGVFGIMLALCIPFVAMGRYVSWPFFEEGVGVAVVAISTATLPFAPLPGADVWRWRPTVSLATIAGAVFLFFGYQLAIIDPFIWALIGVAGMFSYALITGWLLMRQQRPLPRWYAAMAGSYDRMAAGIYRMKPAWVIRFKARRKAAYARAGAAFDRWATRVALSFANGWRRLRGKPPITLV